MDHTPPKSHVVLVTGPSGAGRSTAINVLEDLGFEAIDNIPLKLVPRLLDSEGATVRLALGIDARNRDFSADRLADVRQKLSELDDVQTELVYLDCRNDVLLRRFSETRRRHPLAQQDSPSRGIDAEESLLKGVRGTADYYVDTSDLTPHDLRDQIQRWFGADGVQPLSVVVQSFSYKQGLPRGADMVLDCRFLRNPHWEPELRKMTGQDAAVAQYVSQDARFEPFLAKAVDLAQFLLPACREEGKAHFTIAFGCTGGQHRSVCIAETVAHALAHQGWRVSISHTEMERRGMAAPSHGVNRLSGARQA